MISDLMLQIQRLRTPIPVPPPATPLPGTDAILARPAPGAVAPPTTAEALTGMKRTDYNDLAYNDSMEYVGPSVVQPYLYAANPRKDGTSPELAPRNAPYDNAGLARTIALNKAKADAAKAARLAGNDTGRELNPRTVGFNQESNPNPMNWVALIAIIGIGYFVLVKR